MTIQEKAIEQLERISCHLATIGETEDYTGVAIQALEQTRWIPVSERLPEESGEYLVRPSDAILEDYSDFSEVMIMPYDADCEAFGWWREKYDPVSLGYLDSEFGEFEVLEWMPLPQAYTESEGEE